MDEKKSQINIYILYSVTIVFFIIFIISSRLFLSNIVFSNSNDFYLFIKVLYLLFIIIFILFIVLKIRKDTWEYYSGFLLFNLILIYSLFWITKGFDLTDEGFIISKAWFMFNGLWKENADFIWGTSLINGLWLEVVGSPLLIWERIGYCLLIALMGLLIYKILIKYFNSFHTFTAVFTIVLFCRVNIQTINYNILPGVLLIMSVYFLHLFIEKEDNKILRRIFCIISGVILAVACFSRFTNVIFIVLPLIFFTIHYFIKKDKRIIIEGVIFNYFGILIGFGIGALVLLSTNSIVIYISNIYNMFFKVFINGKNNVEPSVATEAHSTHRLFKIFRSEIMDVFKYFSKIFIPILLLFITMSKINSLINNNDNIKKNINRFINLMVALIFFYYIIKHQHNPKNIFRILVVIMFINITLTYFSNMDFKNKYFIYFWGIFLMMFTSIGSNVGVQTMFSSCGIVFLFTTSLLVLNQSFFFINDSKICFKELSYFLTLFILIIGIIMQSRYVYRDDSRKNLTIMFNKKELAGIFTFKEKKETIEDIDNYFNKINNFKDKRLLIINSQPLLYTILNHKYYVITPWAPWIFLDNVEYLKYKLKELETNNILPDYIILSTKNSRSNGWPLSLNKYSSFNMNHYKLFEEFISIQQYKEIYNNLGYNVYEKKYSP